MTWSLVDPLHRLLTDIGLEGPISAGIVLGADLLLAGILHKELRRGLRFSATLAWLYLTVEGIRCFVGPGGDLDRILRVISALSLSLALAQTLFILAIDFVLGRNNRKPLRPLIRYGILAVAFLAAALIGLKAGGVTTLGVLASGAVVVGGIGAAVAEVLRQVGAGILVQYARPFDVGDMIQVMPMERRGTVLSISWRTTTVRGVDGVELMVPNNDLVTNTVINFGKHERAVRREIEFQCTYDAAPDRVRAAVLPALRDVPDLDPTPPPQLLVAHLDDNGVRYRLRFWTHAIADWELVDAEVRARVWDAFARGGLGFPFPTRTLKLQPEAASDEVATKSARADALRRSQLFARLPPEAVGDIAGLGREHVYGPSEVVMLAGEVGTTMHVVLEGEVAVQAPFDRRELLRLGPGDFFGEMSLVTGAPRAATVVTTMPTRTYVVDQPQFQVMLERHPQVADVLSEILAARQSDLTSALEQKPTDSQRSRHLKSMIMERLKGIFSFGAPTS
ncbi:MAG: hypothetical protein NVS3B10_04320 [Polyangiales bacterium]